MTKTLPNPSSPLDALLGVFMRAGAFAARILTGMLLIMAASVVAVLTAFVGVLLAFAALAMRYTAKRRMQAAPATGAGDDPITLDARRTPRGWTVE